MEKEKLKAVSKIKHKIHNDEKLKIKHSQQKNKITPEVEDELKARGQIVELTYRHLEECKYLEKQGFKGGRASEIDSRLTEASNAP